MNQRRKKNNRNFIRKYRRMERQLRSRYLIPIGLMRKINQDSCLKSIDPKKYNHLHLLTQSNYTIRKTCKQRSFSLEHLRYLGIEININERVKSIIKRIHKKMAIVERMRHDSWISRIIRWGNYGITKFKRIFSNNKKKLLYDISGKIKFEGDDLHVKL